MVGVKYHAFQHSILQPWFTILLQQKRTAHVTVTNKGVATMFKLSPSNLHKLVSRKKYAGGSKGEEKKVSSLKELEEKSELMVQVIKKKTVSSAAGSSKSGGRGRQGEVFRKGESNQSAAEVNPTTIFG